MAEVMSEAKSTGPESVAADSGFARAARALVGTLPDVFAYSPAPASAILISLLAFSTIRGLQDSVPREPEPGSAPHVSLGAAKGGERGTPAAGRLALRVLTAILGASFLLSSLLNFGAKIPLGLAEVSFSSPSASIAEFEVIIGSVLLVAAVVSRLYPYAGAHLLASVGIAEGLLSSSVQGLARGLHESMIPFAVGAWILLALLARNSYKSRAPSPVRTNRELVTALQFFVGGLVALGGLGYASGATYPVGTALGLIHLVVGLVGLFAGYAFLRRRAYAGRFLVAINAITIAYSAFSEGAAQIYALMPPGVDDALIGTIVAMIVSAAIVSLLAGSREPTGGDAS